MLDFDFVVCLEHSQLVEPKKGIQAQGETWRQAPLDAQSLNKVVKFPLTEDCAVREGGIHVVSIYFGAFYHISPTPPHTQPKTTQAITAWV